MKEIGFIYGLVCPIKNKIRYVGQTRYKNIDKRCSRHNRDALSNKFPNRLKDCWIRDSGPVRAVLLEIAPISELSSREIYWINLLPDLTNSTSGGSSKYVHSEYTKAIMSKNKLGNKNHMFGKTYKYSEEHKLKMSLLLKNSEKHKLAIKSESYIKKRQLKYYKFIWCLLNENKTEILMECPSSTTLSECIKSTYGIHLTHGALARARRLNKLVGYIRYKKKFYVYYKQDLPNNLLSTDGVNL